MSDILLAYCFPSLMAIIAFPFLWIYALVINKVQLHEVVGMWLFLILCWMHVYQII